MWPTSCDFFQDGRKFDAPHSFMIFIEITYRIIYGMLYMLFYFDISTGDYVRIKVYNMYDYMRIKIYNFL